MEDEKLLEKLVQDKDFMEEIWSKSTLEEVQKAFQDKGADLTLSEIKDFGSALCMAVENNGKLPDEVLTASGGKLKTWHKVAIACITGVAAVGCAAGATYGFLRNDVVKNGNDSIYWKLESTWCKSPWLADRMSWLSAHFAGIINHHFYRQ